MKQTAVQTLIEIYYGNEGQLTIKDLEQAKQMEKEQIVNAIKLTIEKEYYEQTWAHCGSRNHMAEQYYNETFKSE